LRSPLQTFATLHVLLPGPSRPYHCNEKLIIRWPSDREPSDGHQRKTPIPPDGNFRIFPPASHFKLFPSDGPLSIPIRYLFAMTHLMQIKKFPLDGLFLIPLQCLFAMTHLMWIRTGAIGGKFCGMAIQMQVEQRGIWRKLSDGHQMRTISWPSERKRRFHLMAACEFFHQLGIFFNSPQTDFLRFPSGAYSQWPIWCEFGQGSSEGNFVEWPSRYKPSWVGSNVNHQTAIRREP